MTSARTIVIVPTFDHGATLRRSVASVLAQTVTDLDVVVIGDGAPEVTREVMADLCAGDERVRYLDRPKGERHGEAYRHEVLSASDAEVACYLGDDDLWLPEHVATIHQLLVDADFAHTLPIRLEGEPGHEQVIPWIVDLEREDHRALIVGPEPRENRIPLGCAGHTLAAYRRLPHGWRPAPTGQWSDHWMWQQVLGQPWLRARSGTHPTLLHLPSSLRTGTATDERLGELDRWVALLHDDPWRSAALRHLVEAGLHRGWAREDSMRRSTAAELDRFRSALESALADLAESRHEAARLEREVQRLQHVERERDAMARSFTWRTRGALRRVPGAEAVVSLVQRGRRSRRPPAG